MEHMTITKSNWPVFFADRLESEATVCGPPSTATVLCTWEVPAGRSVVFFTLNGTEVDVFVTNYSFVLSCEGEGPQLVAIAGSNRHNNMTYDLQNLIGEHVINNYDR